MLSSKQATRRPVIAVATATALAVTALVLLPAPAEAGKGRKGLHPAIMHPASYAAPKPAAPPKPPGTGVEKKDTGRVIPGEVVEKKVEKLTDKIDWLSSLDEAKALAQKQHRPIFWLHALGDLDGEC